MNELEVILRLIKDKEDLLNMRKNLLEETMIELNLLAERRDELRGEDEVD